MNQDLVEYLLKYKEIYKREDLVEELKEEYSDKEIKEATDYVYGEGEKKDFISMDKLTKESFHIPKKLMYIVMFIIIVGFAGWLIYTEWERVLELVTAIKNLWNGI